MRACVQRVLRASVRVDDQVVGAIGQGLLVFLGVGHDDSISDARYLAEKIANLRIFSDARGKMNLAVADVGGGILVVSQFTLMGDCRKGRRPAFAAAAEPQRANELYGQFVSAVEAIGIPTATGEFQADMQIELVNDGPVTMLLDSQKMF